MTTKISRLTIDMPRTKHKKIKTAASMMNLSMKDLVLLSIEEFMQRKFNKQTEKILAQSEEGKNLKRFDSLDDLFKDLGI